MISKNGNKKRYEYLDAIKTIAIVFVCSYHFLLVTNIHFNSTGFDLFRILNVMGMGVFSVCVPLFFMVNGALLLNGKHLDIKNHSIRIIKILLQLFIWRGITIIVILLYRGDLFTSYTLQELFKIVVLQKNVESISLAHFWFIKTLLLVYLVYPMIYKIYKSDNNKLKIIFVWIMFCVGILFKEIYTFMNAANMLNNPLLIFISKVVVAISLTSAMILYFYVGAMIHRNKEKIINKNVFKFITIFLLGMLMLCGESYIVEMTSQSVWDNVFEGYTTFATFLMSISLFIIILIGSKYVRENSLFNKITRMVGKNTIYVYYVHWIIGYTFLGVIIKYILFDSEGYIINLLKGIILVLLISTSVEIIKKIKTYFVKI